MQVINSPEWSSCQKTKAETRIVNKDATISPIIFLILRGDLFHPSQCDEHSRPQCTLAKAPWASGLLHHELALDGLDYFS
jgi:hypothetical protein